MSTRVSTRVESQSFTIFFNWKPVKTERFAVKRSSDKQRKYISYIEALKYALQKQKSDIVLVVTKRIFCQLVGKTGITSMEIAELVGELQSLITRLGVEVVAD